MATQYYQPTPPTQQSASIAASPALTTTPGSTTGVIDIGKIWAWITKTLKGEFVARSVLSVLAALTMTLIIAGDLHQAYSDIDTIINGSVPSVNAAQHMAQYIEDIDAKSADYVATGALTATEPCSIIGSNVSIGFVPVHHCDDLNIDAELIQANQQLFLAAHNVTYPGERSAIERITVGLQEYVGDITVMRHEYALVANPQDAHDPHLREAASAYMRATAILHDKITLLPPRDVSGNYIFSETDLPSCTINNRTLAPSTWLLGSLEDNINCLSFINKSHLDRAYQDAAGFLTGSVWLALISGVILLVVIGGTMWRMAMATHRRINIGLTLATLICLVFGFVVVIHLGNLAGQHGAFGEVVVDDYKSIYDAALLKRYATAANADESRWLIAQEFGDQDGIAHWAADWKNNTAQVNQLITDAQNNQTWPEEIQPLADMRSNWDAYYGIDGHIRQIATDASDPKHILDAEQLSTGDSNIAFGKFTDAVDRLSAANQSHYDQTGASAESTLNTDFPLSLILFPLLGILAAWGISTRLREF